MLPCCAPAQTTVSQHSVGQTRCIRDGDLVIVYEGHSSMKAVHVNSKERFDNKFGSFAQKDWLGLPFGSKVHARSGVRGWVHLLAPSPTLWSLVLPHRTQILYIADISMVCLHLDLAPGCVVLESGTGSASLTHSLVRAVAPLGHVHTFEFHSGRAEEAAKELARNGLSPWVTVRQRNIEQDGFPCAMLCSFSPCIEQVHRTCEALELHGFIDLQTVECLLRMYDVRSEHLITSFGPEQGNQRQHKQHKQNLMQRQPDKAPQEAGAASTTADSLALPDAKRARTQDATGALESGDTPVGAGASGTPAAGMLPSTVQRNSVTTHVTAKPVVDARGHTGYLTFARKFV
ncbi:S-adenosyl-L-methionine-dependent methyltransferase [Haematococcus lacustris]